MSVNTEQKAEIVKEYGDSTTNTGSPEVQIALLSAHITDLSGHFKEHSHHNHSLQRFLLMVSKRRKMLDYLKKKNVERYRSILTRLGLRR